MKKIGTVLTVLASLSASVAVAADCDPNVLDIKNNGNISRFSVELADDVQERALGLMNRPEMAPFAGMLFVYDAPRQVSFWMKNTLIPLDMLFIDDTGVVTRIHENAVPLDLTGIPGGDNIQYVLEINGGMAATLGIVEGAEIRHPDIKGDGVIWACDD